MTVCQLIKITIGIELKADFMSMVMQQILGHLMVIQHAILKPIVVHTAIDT